MKHCQRHGPEKDPYCVDCWKDECAREALCPSDATACSADVVEQLKRLADDWFARAVDEMNGAVKEKNARDGMNFYQHTARAAVLSDCRKQLMEIILANADVEARPRCAPPQQDGF